MAVPRPRSNVPRDRVVDVVRLFLGNPDVGDVDCVEQGNHAYTVRGRGRIPPPRQRRTTKKKT